MCAISSILYCRAQKWNPRCWKMTSTLWMKNYLVNYLTEMYDIFLWNASRDKHSSSACLQTSVPCCPEVWGQGLGLRWFGRSRQRVSHGNESVLWSTTDDFALPRGSNRKTTTHQSCFFPCPSPWLCLKAWEAQYGCRKVTKHMRIKCLHNIIYQDGFIWLTAYCCL